MEASTQSSLCEGLCSVTHVLLGRPLQSESRIQPSKINWMKQGLFSPLNTQFQSVLQNPDICLGEKRKG